MGLTLSIWLDSELPRRYTSGQICGGVQKGLIEEGGLTLSVDSTILQPEVRVSNRIKRRK